MAISKLHLPAQLDTISGFITIALIWLGLTQVGLMMQGFEMMGLDFEKPAAPKKETAVAAEAAEPVAAPQASPTQLT